MICTLTAVHLRAGTNEAPVKLAIVSESPETASAADVLTAEFSKNDKVQLLERAEIEKVYREQGLSAGNKDYLKLGQVLGADGLLALQSVTEGKNRYISVQLVAVRPGVILEDERFGQSAQNATGWADDIIHHLDPLLPKLNVLSQDAIPLSVVNFHAGVRTAAAAELEKQMFFLTVERLALEKRLFVLERKRMQSLSEEKELAHSETEAFWNGKYLLDGALDRDGFDPDHVTIHARLIPPGGSPVLIEASGSRTNCAEAVNQLVEKVLTAMKLDSKPVPWNTADEADKFFKEAQWNLAWGDFPQARQSAAAAWALGKHDVDAITLRVRTFMPPPDSGVIYFPPREKPAPEKINDALHALQLYQMFSQNLPPDEPKLDSDWYKLGLDNLTIATRVLQQFNWSPEFYTSVSDKLGELRAAARSVAELLSWSPSVHDSYFVGSRKVKYDDLYHFEERPSIYGLKVEGGCLWQEKPEDTLALYRELMASPVFRYLHERFWFRDADHSSTRLPSPPRLVAWNEADQKRLPDLWQRFVTELKESPDVFQQMEARALRLADVKFPDLNRTFDTRAAYEAANRTANQAYEQELSSAFTDFLDAFVTNRIYFKTNSVDILYLNWGVDDLVEHMGGNTGVTLDKKESLQRQYRTEYAAKLAAKDEGLSKQLAAWDAELRAESAKMEKLQAFEKQKAFLKAGQPFNPSTFVPMFIFGFKGYSREQAQEIRPLLAEYKKGLSGAMARIGEMQVGQVEANVEHIINPVATAAPPAPNRVAMTNGNPARPPGENFSPGRPPWLGQPGTPPQFAQHASFVHGQPPLNGIVKPTTEAPVPEPLVSSNIITVKDFYPMPDDGLPGDHRHDFVILDHQWMEGSLLLDFRYNAWVYSSDSGGNVVFVGMAMFEPATKHWTVVVLPETFKEPVPFSSQQGVLWHGELYSSHIGTIRKFDFVKQTWGPSGFALDSGGQFYNLDGRLFVTDYNSIQEITENGHATRLLASIQRQPPVSSLDSQGALMRLALFTDAQKNLCAAVHNKIFRWDGNDWHEIGAATTSCAPAVFDNGVIFPTDGFNSRPARISRFEMQSNSVELCLSQIAQELGRRGYEPRQTDAKTPPRPLWKLPAELSLPNFSAALWRDDLFLIADHSEKQDIVAEERGTRPDGTLEISHVVTGSKFASKDGYNTALFCFSRDLPAAHEIRLKFEASDGCPPMSGIESKPGFAIPGTVANRAWMQFTTNLMLCGRYAVPPNFKPGIWVASLDSIASEANALKQMQFNVRQQEKTKAEQIEKEVHAEDQQARQAFLKKFDFNHNGIIDPDEQDAAREDPYFIKYYTAVIRAQKEADTK